MAADPQRPLSGVSMDDLCRELQLRVEEQRKQQAALETKMEQKFAQREAEIATREQELVEKEKALAIHKENVMGLLGKNEDILEINAGGQVHAVSRGTLCLVEGSVLASMFSGRWEDKMQRDSAGRPFLDVDPHVFEAILVHLRAKRMAGPEDHIEPPTVEPRKQNLLSLALRYYGLGGPEVSLPVALPTVSPSVTSLFINATAVQVYAMPSAEYRGYLIDLQRPFRLEAVHVGLAGNHAGTVVVVGTPPQNILAQAPVQLRACAEEPEATHVADGFGVVLQPPQCFVMVCGSGQIKYQAAGNGPRVVASFNLQSRYQLPLAPNSYHIVMALRGCEV